jgi:2-polyprenyl-6-hydroxyphenyl methylase/3-demethylubiquinone-9 3-methyltransferase
MYDALPKQATEPSMGGYYAERLAAERLRRVYEVAPRRVQQYLDTEIRHVAGRISPGEAVLELGCGYGRVMKELAHQAGTLIGIDTSLASLQLARQHLAGLPGCRLVKMDASAMAFHNQAFDLVVCIQNGISAFHVDQRTLVAESIRVTRPGGRVLFSSYSARFWPHRLEWFQLQADHGLVGEIDHQATGNGVIICKDGFKATTVSPDEFAALTAEFNVKTRIQEVDDSSVFCEIAV